MAPIENSPPGIHTMRSGAGRGGGPGNSIVGANRPVVPSDFAGDVAAASADAKTARRTKPTERM
jgi:hypothetical protein